MSETRPEPRRSAVFTPARIGGLELRSRVIHAGCYEGLAREGAITEELVEHHRRLAAGGMAMTTLGYCAVSFDGRGFAHELWASPELLPSLRRFAGEVHSRGAAVSVQLVRCGFFSSPGVFDRRPLGASRRLCLYRGAVCTEMTPEEIAAKTEDFARAARLVQDAGFDAVELHAGHGYLLSQFLSPWTNRRRGGYGGSLAVEEAVEAARRFEQEGASALIPSCGFTARTPLYMMRGRVPIHEMAANQRTLLSWAARTMFGRLFVQRYRYRPLFQLEEARRIREAVAIPVIYVGGVLSLAHMEALLAEGFPLLQLGRATGASPRWTAAGWSA